MVTLKRIAGILGLLAMTFANVTAFAHLATHDRAHVHEADGSIVYVDESAPATSAIADTRALFAALEERHASPPAKRPVHEARGAAHLAFPLLQTLSILFVPCDEPVVRAPDLRAPALALSPLPLEHDSRGPPAVS